MDLSDGLGRDLPRLAAAGGCGFRLDREAIPRARGVTAEEAVNDGEDYELLFALTPRSASRLVPKWAERFPRLPLTCVGALVEGGGEPAEGGWEHFAP